MIFWDKRKSKKKEDENNNTKRIWFEPRAHHFRSLKVFVLNMMSPLKVFDAAYPSFALSISYL